MSTSLPRGGAAALDAIAALADEGLPPQEFYEELVPRFSRVVPADGLFFAAADPETRLATGSGVVQGMVDELCQPLWDHEFQVPDYNKFADLAQGPRHVADLHEATGGRPQRSARWREFNVIGGFGAELRAAFTVDGSCWGLAQLNRHENRPFSREELDWVELASPVIGRGLRRSLVSHASTAPGQRGPGIMLLDEDNRLVSATPEAEVWLADLDSTMRSPSSLGIPMPIEAQTFAVMARERTRQGEDADTTFRTRLRTRAGMWLLLHASLLRDANGEPGNTAVVIEPAKASDVAPIIVEAYGLTARELEVTRRIARGQGTNEIAAEMFLSPHTVRDHVKAVFEKVGVSSRGELTAKLFAEHYHDPLAEAIRDQQSRIGADVTN